MNRTKLGYFLTLLLALPLLSAPIESTGRSWVFFTSEQLTQSELQQRLEQAAESYSHRSLERRRKVIDHEPPLRQCDLPPTAERVSTLESAGAQVLGVYRYLNAVTIATNQEVIEEVRRFDFVERVRPVERFSARVEPQFVEPGTPIEKRQFKTADEEVYGNSWDQLQMVNIPAVHELGYRGNGVLIGHQDSGIDFPGHACFDHIDVLGMWDFVNGDSVIFDQDDDGSGRHGTRTLSVIAGLDSGRYIGVAPDASYILTKTENSISETSVEEDYWVAGLWYCDSAGVDVISSSVSYRNWYSYSELDGETAVTTRAADSAATAGIVMVNSVGNTGNNNYPTNKIGAPADGHYVIGVGGVRTDSTRNTATSMGPTYDGRIKPNVAAQSSQVWVASQAGNTLYTRSAGTSYAAPTVAGVAALMLQANPQLTPDQVMSILQQTASQSANPDTLLGYGIVDALAAVEAALDSLNVERRREHLPENFSFEVYPNPFNALLRIEITTSESVRGIRVYDLNGRQLPMKLDSGTQVVDFTGYGAGIYLVRADWQGGEAVRKVVLVK